MKYSRHFVIALMSTPAMGFVVPLGNNGVLHPTYPQSFKTFRSRSDDSALRMAVDPIGTNIVLSNLPILLAPIAALSAGLASLGQRNQIQEEIATTEIELESIKKRLESSNLQINTSFGAAALSLVLAVSNVFGGAVETASVVSLPSTTLAKEQVTVTPSPSIPATVTATATTPEISKAADVPASEGNTFNNLMKKMEAATESKPIDAIRPVEVKPPAVVEAPKLEASTAESSKVDAPKVDTAKVETPKIEQKIEAPKADASKADAVKVEVPKIEISKVDAVKVEAPKIEVSKVDAVKVESPKAEQEVESGKKQVAEVVKPTEPAKVDAESGKSKEKEENGKAPDVTVSAKAEKKSDQTAAKVDTSATNLGVSNKAVAPSTVESVSKKEDAKVSDEVAVVKVIKMEEKPSVDSNKQVATTSSSSVFENLSDKLGVDASTLAQGAAVVAAAAVVGVGLISLSSQENDERPFSASSSFGSKAAKKSYAPTKYSGKVPVKKVKGYLDNLTTSTTTFGNNRGAGQSGYLDSLKVASTSRSTAQQGGYLDGIDKGTSNKAYPAVTTKPIPVQTTTPSAKSAAVPENLPSKPVGVKLSEESTNKLLKVASVGYSGPSVAVSDPKVKGPNSAPVIAAPASTGSYLESMSGSGPPKVKAPFKAPYNPKTAQVPVASGPTSYLDNMSQSLPLSSTWSSSEPAPTMPREPVAWSSQSQPNGGWSPSQQNDGLGQPQRNGDSSPSPPNSNWSPAQSNGSWSPSQPNDSWASGSSNEPSESSASARVDQTTKTGASYSPFVGKKKPVAARPGIGGGSYLDAL